MGRFRDNGLSADAYVALVPLPADYAESVLQALRGADIAGYVHLSATAQPQLFVDVAKQSAAADLIHTGFPEVSAALDPQPPSVPSSSEKTGDPLWDDLVARYYEPTSSGDTESSWPAAEDLDPDETTDPPPNSETDSEGSDDRSVSFLVIRRRYSPSEDSSEGTGDRADRAESAGAEAGEDDHYVPPPAPPLPQGDGLGRLAWGGLLGAPTLWVLMMLLGQTVPNWMALLLVVWFIGGFVVLIARMRDDRPPGDSGPDNGAVV